MVAAERYNSQSSFKKTLNHKFVIILTLTGFLSFGQDIKLESRNNISDPINEAELDSLYIRALNNRFDLILQSGLKYVEMNTPGKRISKSSASKYFKFLTDDELIDLSIKEKKTIHILRLGHKIIAKDTVDINFGNVSVTAKRGIFLKHGIHFKKANFSLACGGTKDYQPDMRFVFNRKQKRWDLKINRFFNGEESNTTEFDSYQNLIQGKWHFKIALNEKREEFKYDDVNGQNKIGVIQPNLEFYEDGRYKKELPVDPNYIQIGHWEITENAKLKFSFINEEKSKQSFLVKIIELKSSKLVIQPSENLLYVYERTIE